MTDAQSWLAEAPCHPTGPVPPGLPFSQWPARFKHDWLRGASASAGSIVIFAVSAWIIGAPLASRPMSAIQMAPAVVSGLPADWLPASAPILLAANGAVTHARHRTARSAATGNPVIQDAITTRTPVAVASTSAAESGTLTPVSASSSALTPGAAPRHRNVFSRLLHATSHALAPMVSPLD